MEISLLSNPLMSGKDHCVMIGLELMNELGVVPGQRIKFDAGGKEVILEVLMGPGLKGKEAYLSETTLSLLQEHKIKFSIPEITLGCDPEFFILSKGRRLNASAYLPFQGQIGCDGNLGELRPMYSTHEAGVKDNLRKLILGIPGAIKRQEFSVGAGYPKDAEDLSYEAYSYYDGIAAGFHVHLGLPPELLNTREDFHRTSLNHLVQCLDWYVSAPLVLLETDNQRRVGRCSYGHPGDFRTSNITLEYRTPGGFYLRSPILAQGLLGLSLMITEYLVGKIKEASQDFLKLRDLSASALREIIPLPRPHVIQGVLMSPNKSAAATILPKIQEEIRALPNYKFHAGSVDEFFRVVDTGTIPSAVMLHNWRSTRE